MTAPVEMVRCVDASGCIDITVGKDYRVVQERLRGMVEIIDDAGDYARFLSRRFVPAATEPVAQGEATTGHTPGPWHAYPADYQRQHDGDLLPIFVIGPQEFHTVAQVRAGCADDNLPAQTAANAALIASAPQMASDLASLRAENARLREALELVQSYIARDRQARIDAEIDACTGCNMRGFSKHSDCDGCTAAVDEAIAAEMDAARADIASKGA